MESWKKDRYYYALFHYNHNHDPENGRFTSGSNSDVAIKSVESLAADKTYPADHSFYRVTHTRNEHMKDRMYVSNYWEDYDNDYFRDGHDIFVVEYKTQKPCRVAGEDQVRKTLSEVGAGQLMPSSYDVEWNEWSAMAKSGKYVDRDFLKSDSETRALVIKRLRQKGYHAITDVVDNDIGFSRDDSATIVIDPKILKRGKTQKIYDKNRGWLY